MKPYNSFDHYEPKDWLMDRDWLTNRSLFLIYLTDKNNERFHGGDGQTPEECVRNLKKSFYPEYLAMIEKNPRWFNRAFVIWLNNMEDETPPYVGVK